MNPRTPTSVAICTALAALCGCFHDLDVFLLDGGSDAAVPDSAALTDSPRERDSGGFETSRDQTVPDLSPCAAPKIFCGGACVDPSSSSSHCGGCNKPCAAHHSCLKGTCGCTPPRTACGGLCVDLSSSSLHCGGCGKKCAAGLSCQQGKCRCDSKVAFSCGSSTGLYCSAGACGGCPKAVFNCDGKGGCECVGKCSGGSCDSSCTYGKKNQCGSIYHACTQSGKCEPCKPGYKNCDRHGGCATPESSPCS